METIQLSIDESLMAEVQQATNALQMTPSDFIRVALERARNSARSSPKNAEMLKAIWKEPQQPEEIEEWQSEQDWEA